MKKAVSLLFFILMLFVVSGCATSGCGGENCRNPDCTIHYMRVNGYGDQIAVTVDILDDIENRLLRTKAELYLKLEISNIPGVYWLYPLNIENQAAGNRRISFRTPFFVSYDRQFKINAELLDEDRLSDEEVSLLVDAAKVSGMLICDGINIFVCSRIWTKRDFISLENKTAIADLMGRCATVAVNNMKPFESFGSCEYVVSRVGSEFVCNPLTIIDEDGRARCNLRFYLVE